MSPSRSPQPDIEKAGQNIEEPLPNVNRRPLVFQIKSDISKKVKAIEKTMKAIQAEVHKAKIKAG